MKAWILDNVNEYSLKEVEKPKIHSGQALIKVHACGICGSDIPRVYQNGAHKMPLIIGHEFAGEIIDICNDGSIEYSYNTGDRVGIFPLIPCMECGPCKKQKYEMCRHYSYLGSRCDGGFADEVVVPLWNLIKIPENVSYEAAAMLEPMAVAVHAMRRVTDGDTQSDKDSKKIAIYGLGTIGTLLAVFLNEAGYRNIYAIGNKDFQRDTFERLGFNIECFCDSRKADVSEWISNISDGNGADIFFECIGKSETISDTINLTAPGGKVCLVGNPYTDVSMSRDVYWKILRNQIEVTGTWNSSFTHDKYDDWNYVISRLADETIAPEKLITHRYGIDDIDSGFKLMRDKSEDYIKVMMVN